MVKISKILSPTFFGCGVSLVLFASMNNLPIPAYLVNIPFWVLVVFPSGLFWKNKFLKKINEGQFPSQMKSYRQMFVFSKKAILYQLFINQIGYHSLLGLTFMIFTYCTRTFYDKITPNKTFIQFIKDGVFGFFKLRAFFGVISLLTQFWGAKLNLKKNSDGSVYLTSNVKRILLMKQGIINLLWMTSIACEAHKFYPKVGISGSLTTDSLLH